MSEFLKEFEENALKTLAFENDKQKKQFTAFARFFLNECDEEDLHDVTPETYAVFLKSQFELFQTRLIGTPLVRLYNPDTLFKITPDRTIIEIINDDMPFLVDSLTALLSEKHYEIRSIFHPVQNVKRADNGAFISFPTEDGERGGVPESWMQVHIGKIEDEKTLRALELEITDMLSDVRKAVCDWHVMLRRLDDIISDYSQPGKSVLDAVISEEARAFLRWLGSDHFTFLGYREYKFNVKTGDPEQIPENGLGLFRNPEYKVLRHEGEEVDVFTEIKNLTKDPLPITIIRTNRKSAVHRISHMDQIFITIYENGEPVGQKCFIGLFTSAAYNVRAKEIPLVRHKISEVIRRAGFRPAGHDGKALSHIIDTYPRDELFQIDAETLYNNVLGILQFEVRPGIKIFPRRDRFDRFVSVMVYLPRERLNTDARTSVGNFLADAYGGRVSNFSLWFSQSNYIRIKYVIAVTPSALLHPSVHELEEKVRVITANWNDALRETAGRLFTNISPNLLAEYAYSFGPGYQDAHTPEQALQDLTVIEKLSAENPVIPVIENYQIFEKEQKASLRFKVFSIVGASPLSDCLPLFENLGFRVITEHPYVIKTPNKEIWIQEFANEYHAPNLPNIETIRKNLADAFSVLRKGEAENDGLNRLVMKANLTVRHIAVLRALSKYLKQTGIQYSQELIGDCLVKHSTAATDLIELFETRFNPDTLEDISVRQEKADKIVKKIQQDLSNVSVLDEDVILRRMTNAITSTLRTNLYQGKSYISFKFDCEKLDGLPLPRPMREIWVYSPDVEGTHLRFGMVARGGLRWSDRKEDFRREVLGLVKAQKVKNAVIVPVGAKGGFYPKRLPDMKISGRGPWLAEGERCYRIFIRALLDITDNIVNDKVVPPAFTVRYDQDDPYLVVAADKGTATYSDIANGISKEYNFWLGDAFASGGSVGYDHKKMGITARGAWEAVKRHFRELGCDIQSEAFTVIGVGDMSGDVFGNGMLLSRKTKLLAAFNHMHIFIDPDPDPEISYKERERLFALPTSAWDDYNKALISKGGGVFSRNAKDISLSEEMKNLTGLQSDKVRPDEFLNALLKAQVDLLWFGGIGAYIKSPQETHADVGDKANDTIRINGDEVRARVIGEGANLACTQKGRVAFALKGGRLNTDAVDNSAGVDCSDHEVNIKIALGTAIVADELKSEQRDDLLAKMTDDVAELVLKTNYNQTLSLSVSESFGPDRIGIHARLISYLERNANLNREVEFLPDDRVLYAGRDGFKGLTRPELCVVLAYSKLHLYEVILKSDIPNLPFLQKIVFDYFPEPVRKLTAGVTNHRLRKEIISTVLSNQCVNEAGLSMVYRLTERLNVNPEEAVRAFIAAHDIIGMDELSKEINHLDNIIPALLQIKMFKLIRRGLFDQIRRVLLQRGEVLNPELFIQNFKSEFTILKDTITDILTPRLFEQFSDFRKEYLHENAPVALVDRVCSLYFLKNAFDIISAAKVTGFELKQTAKFYFETVELLSLDMLRRKATEITLTDVYDQMALSQIIADLDTAVYDVALHVLKTEQSVQVWAEKHAEAIRNYTEIFTEAAGTDNLGLSRLSIIVNALKGLPMAIQ